MPVIPGVMQSLHLCLGEYCSYSWTVGGLVPTRLISPFNTLKNWGNSSRLVFLIKAPTFVILGSSSILNISPFISFLSSSSFLRSSASIYIDLNLYILNLLPFLPILVCEKKTGPLESILIAGARKIVKIPVMISPTIPPSISSPLFMNRRL